MELKHVMLSIVGLVALACLILNPVIFVTGAVPAIAAIFLGGEGILPTLISDAVFALGTAVAFAVPPVWW